MAKNSQVNIRFDDGTASQLEGTAAQLGISVSALVRHLTKTFLDDVRKTGSVKLKPDWTGVFERADGRSAWGDRRTIILNDETSSPQNTRKSVRYDAKSTKKKPKRGGGHGGADETPGL